MPVLDLLLVLCCGFVVGGLAGLVGIGGSFLLVPILTIVLRHPVDKAVGSTLCQLLGPATAALLTRKLTREQLRLPLILTGGVITGILLGIWMKQEAGDISTVTVNNREVPAEDLLVHSAYFCLLTVIGLFGLYEVHRDKIGRRIPRGALARVRIPPLDTFPELDAGELSIPVLSLFGLVSGLASGLLGISGALILVPGFVYLLGIRAKQAILASLVVVWITAFFGTIGYAWVGSVDLNLAFALMLGGTIGARLGSELNCKLKGQALRACIGWSALCAAVLVSVRLFELLG